VGGRAGDWLSRTAAVLTRAWRLHSRGIVALALTALAVGVMVPRLTAAVEWTPDSLFYQAQMYELRGASPDAALRRVFSSPAAEQVTHLPGAAPLIKNPAWIRYSARFYRRRWLVPALAAAIYPLAGDRSLLDVSIVGYVIACLALFGLVRARFSDGVSALAVAACLLQPAFQGPSWVPRTDSWGVAIEALGLLVWLRALERGGRWTAAGVLTTIALSITHDATVVLLGALAWFAVHTRERRGWATLAGATVASIPVAVLFGAPLTQEFAWVYQNFNIPHDASWHYLAAHYPAAVWSVIRGDAEFPQLLRPVLAWYAISCAIVLALCYVLIAAPRRDVLFMLIRGAFLGALVTLALLPNYTYMRLELVLLPCVAVGLAFTIERLGTLVRPGLRMTRWARAASGGSARVAKRPQG
jgi:hypothetical protein